ncbi:aldehyde dehydrogenase family protein [Roseovarius aestuarii]|uniref:aldehyde dehydrogenase (NAD(+)) n=1 Tax=Roseovarius aestuarii TaxID=475083 RepID=A0A1X7BYA7_9RHOB|nr:aldehyde dehydrogenase family protein [Roseovarius aestuarii]SMC14647.1 Putative aldehyde dehydrogenase AldA [Roseovarius aestuarii]
MDLQKRDETLFINGEWVRGSGELILTPIDPTTGDALGRLETASADQVEGAAQASARAFADWKVTASSERAAYLRGFAKGLATRQERLVDVQMRNNGKPRVEAEIDVGDAIATFKYYAGLADTLDACQDARVDHAGGDHIGMVRREPVGPVGMIVPWNFPLVTSAWKIAPALAAGCTAVMKTSEMTPLAELVYGEIAQEIGLPPGVLNIVTGAMEVGVALTGSRAFRKISFTGSNMVGAKVMAAIAPRCLPLSLELGGKAPIIVTEDVDINHAVDCIIGGIFFNAGQMCSASSRLLVHGSIEAKLIEALLAKTETLVTASPFAETCDMGPMTARAQYIKVREYLARAQADGLDCVTGGISKETIGNFVVPTIYRNVPHDNPVWIEEIFGPVLATTRFETDEEALALANATEYGLVGTVVSADEARAKTLANGIEAGQIWINTPQVVYPDSAWGGFKCSGIGRELGPWGLAGYQGVKHITCAC